MDKAPPKIGRYLVLRTLGRGALGTVYLANDPLIDRAVAVKVLGEWFDSDEGRERFIREARAAARLMHRNIVTIFDVADHEGQLFIAMEYIQGQTLRELIGRQQTVALTRKLEIVEDLCSALAYAHKQGVVHRDIRPTNVMVDEEGVVKVLDFGISRIAGSGMTRQGALIGSLNYMSPEQVTGSLVDQRSDVFAIGALFYELLSYRKAFEGNFQARHEIIYDDPRPLAELSPDVDGEIISIVARALEKDPDRRYQDLSQMRNDIARARRLTPGGRSDTTSVIEPGSVAAESGRREARELARRRIANISESLNKAEGAFEAGDLEAAFAECEHAPARP